MNRTRRVVVVDDHRTVAELLCLAISSQPDMSCVGTAASADEAEALVRVQQPDVLVTDVRLGDKGTDRDGVQLVEGLRRDLPDVLAVLLTAHADRRLMQRAADAGACCLLAKDGSLPDLLRAVRTVERGALVVGPQLLHSLMVSVAVPRPPRLTDRERQVLDRLVLGSDTQSIAADLGITRNTCRGYLKNVMIKLGAHTQHQAVAIALRDGLTHGAPHG